MSLVLGPQPRVKPTIGEDGTPAATTVREVRAFVIGSKKTEEEAGGGADCHSQVSACDLAGAAPRQRACHALRRCDGLPSLCRTQRLPGPPLTTACALP